MDASGRRRTMCGLALLALAGCYGPPTYAPSPYGPGMGAPVYTTPPGGTPVYPQGVYPQGITPQPGMPTPVDPQVGSQPYTRNKTPVYDESAPRWQTPQPVTPGVGQSTSPTTGEKLVPQYDDPNAAAPQPVQPRRPRPAEPDSIDLFENSSPFKPDGMGMNESTAEPGPVFASASHVELGEPAALQTSYSQTQETGSDFLPPEPNPFDHDAQEFRWLRGVVDFDAQEKRWHILYDLHPDESDELGGEIALVGEPQVLRALRVQDVVLVEGHVDTSAQDRFGKPCYRVEHVQRLQPQQSAAGSASSAGKQGLGVSPWGAQGS